MFKDLLSKYAKLAALKGINIQKNKMLVINSPIECSEFARMIAEEAYKAGKLRAIGVSNFYPDRFVDLAEFCEVTPAVNQVETHVFNQQIKLLEVMKEYGTKIMSWGPFAEGRNDFFTNPTLQEIGKEYGKSVAQVALRYLIQRDIKYWDKNGNGMKDGEDQDYIGNGAPKFEMNMTNTFSWKGFTFMFDLQWVYGNKLINFTRQLMGNRVTFSNAYADIPVNAWTPENQNTMVPSLRLPGDGYENDVDT